MNPIISAAASSCSLHQLLRSALPHLVTATLLCGLVAVSVSAKAAERAVIAYLDNEMPDYSIAREYAKHRVRFPYIRPVDPARSGAFDGHEQINYASPEGIPLYLDLYTPQHSEHSQDSQHNSTATPLVVLIHGGGWRSGDKSHLTPIAKYLAKRGIAAATISYRTSRQALYPAGLDDVTEALGWLRAHSGDYHLDASKLALLGASSGAHMATLLGNQLGSQHQELPISAIINLDGVVETVSEDVRRFEDKPGKVSYFALWIGGRYQQYPQLWREASPQTYVSPQSPPTLFLNSAQPRFHSGREQYVADLNRYGIKTAIHEIPDTPHTFWLFHPWHDQANAYISQFLNAVFDLDRGAIETSTPDSLSAARIEQLPEPSRTQWRNYFQHSQQLLALDQQLIESELINSHRPLPAVPLRGLSAVYVEGHQLSESELHNLLSYQTPSGGWSKGSDFFTLPRAPRQSFGTETHFVPTFDNGATFAELRLLSQQAQKHPGNALIASALTRAIDLVLSAQMPSGGWPQTFPLRDGYHNWSTYNDNVTANVINLLLDIIQQPAQFRVSPQQLESVKMALSGGVESVIAEQRWLAGRDTGAWGQQHDPITGQLTAARAFEMAALASNESADLLLALMRIKDPSTELQRAIRGGINWLQSIKMVGVRWQRYPDHNSALIADTQAEPLWPRMVDLRSGVALFGDRDGSVHLAVGEISLERQQRYGWYSTKPNLALEHYKNNYSLQVNSPVNP